MGKPTGFLDYEREDAKASSPKERIKLNEFLRTFIRRKAKMPAAKMYGLYAICQNGKSYIRYGIRLSSGNFLFLNGMIFFIS